ncbi:MAG: transposase domain-containing protein, partial [Candidatus Electrothrix sp. LOE1_4_5]|nr:transposase domain-containing protein [Candidatus Electrothrix gigas]
AGIFSLIVTCKRHDVNVFGYLPDILYRVANGHPVSQIDDLLPWNWKPDRGRLKIDPTLDYVDIKYPPDLLIKRLGLENRGWCIDNVDFIYQFQIHSGL